MTVMAKTRRTVEQKAMIAVWFFRVAALTTSMLFAALLACLFAGCSRDLEFSNIAAPSDPAVAHKVKPICRPETSLDGDDLYPQIQVQGDTATVMFHARPELVGGTVYVSAFGLPADRWPMVRLSEVAYSINSPGSHAASVDLSYGRGRFDRYSVVFACLEAPELAFADFYSHDNQFIGFEDRYQPLPADVLRELLDDVRRKNDRAQELEDVWKHMDR